MIDIFNNYIIYKPFGVISQFSPHAHYESLGSVGNFESNVYPIGRLDAESEGLLILSNNPQLNHQLLDPKNVHERSYWVQVEGLITETHLDDLKKGVLINLKGKKHFAQPQSVQTISPPSIPALSLPIQKESSWIELVLTEGKYHQVRKMTAHIGFPTLRLVRNRIENIKLNDLNKSSVLPVDSVTLRTKLNLD